MPVVEKSGNPSNDMSALSAQPLSSRSARKTEVEEAVRLPAANSSCRGTFLASAVSSSRHYPANSTRDSMAPSTIHAEFKGPIVMIGFGSIGRGTLPLLLRHLRLDRSKITIIDPDDTNRHIADKEGLASYRLAITRNELCRNAETARLPRPRPGTDRQSVGRHILCGHHEVRHGFGRTLHRYGGRAVAGVLQQPETQPLGAVQLRAARRGHETQGPPSRRPHRGELLRRQSRHGFMVRQAGAAQHLLGPRQTKRTPEQPERAGAD